MIPTFDLTDRKSERSLAINQNMPPNIQEILHKALITLPDPPPLGGLTFRPITGGDISDAYQLLTKDNRQWFCKFNDNRDFPDLFVKEAKGLASVISGPFSGKALHDCTRSPNPSSEKLMMRAV
jgi:hypothetical protein